ncbi:hypothetical protein PBS_30360 [Paraburkholderia sp. 2C]
MTWFIVRVELLHKPLTATAEDYSQLHARMSRAGYQTTVMGSAGQRFVLPPAEYFRIGVGTVADARQDVVRAVSTGLRPGLSFRVFVAETSAWAAHNLAAA